MPEATSPADTLKTLELSLEANQRDQARLKAQIADVKKTVDDIDQKTKDVDKTSATNEEAYQKLKEWAGCKEKALKPKVPDPQNVADQESAGSKEVAKLKEDADKAGRAIWPLEVRVAKRKVDTAAAQKYFDKIAGIPARNAEILKEVADLQKKADAEEAAKNCSKAYFYVLVMLDLLARYDRRTPEQYAKALQHAGNVLAGAVKNQREAEEKLEAAKAAEKAAVKAFQDRKAKWIQEIADKLPKEDCKKISPQPCEPPKGGYEPKEPPKGYKPTEPPPPKGYEPPEQPPEEPPEAPPEEPPTYDTPTQEPSKYEPPTQEPPKGYEPPKQPPKELPKEPPKGDEPPNEPPTGYEPPPPPDDDDYEPPDYEPPEPECEPPKGGYDKQPPS